MCVGALHRPVVGSPENSFLEGDQVIVEQIAPVRIFVNRGKVQDGILEAARANLSGRELARVERIMTAPRWQFRRRRVQERIIDEAVDSMLVAGVVVATPEGTEAALDWSAVLEFIKELLPVILHIIALF